MSEVVLPSVVRAYIRSLTDKKKGRILRATLWKSGNPDRSTGYSCLVGHAEGVWTTWQMCDRLHCDYSGSVMHHFDMTVHEYGLVEVVRAVKLAAGAKLPEVEVEVAEEVSEVVS